MASKAKESYESRINMSEHNPNAWQDGCDAWQTVGRFSLNHIVEVNKMIKEICISPVKICESNTARQQIKKPDKRKGVRR